MKILLTGATGYVGGRLLSLLQQQGMSVRCVTRRPEALQDRVNSTTEVVQADVFDSDSLKTAFEAIETAYYFVHPGDPLDCWRVEAFEPQRRLRLKAEMKLPGRAWLEFEVIPCEQGSIIRQTAIFDPLGLAGLLYWYGIYRHEKTRSLIESGEWANAFSERER